jgi:hypothetical protein
VQAIVGQSWIERIAALAANRPQAPALRMIAEETSCLTWRDLADGGADVAGLPDRRWVRPGSGVHHA